MAAAMREQPATFRQKFDRYLAMTIRSSLILMDTPIPVEVDRVDREIVEAMVTAGIPPEPIYAYKRSA
jgi:hypothetical protein